jgi:hypothetical protein
MSPPELRRILASQLLFSEDCVSRAAANSLTIAEPRAAGDERVAAWSPAMVCLRYGNWLLALAPLGVLIWVVSRYSVDVPFYDQWDFVPLLDKMYQGRLTFGDLWAQFNEHRIFFPKLLMLGLARLTHWNIRCENAASVALAIGIFLLLLTQIRATARALGAHQLRWGIPACALVVFSISQYENWMWGWQVGLLLGLLAALGGILLLANQPFRWGRFAGSVLLAFVATFSFANGVLVWPIGLAVVWFGHRGLPKRKAALVIWSAAAMVSFWLYVRDYHAPPEHPALTVLFLRPLAYITYLLRFIGGTCAQYGNGGILPDKTYATAFGVSALVILGWAGWKVRRFTGERRVALLPYFALAAYSLGSALMITTGRAGIGTAQAMASRYCSLTGPLWFAIIILLMVLRWGTSGAQNAPSACRENRLMTARVAGWLLVGVLVFLAAGSALAIRSAKELSSNLADGRLFVLAIETAPKPGGPLAEPEVILPNLTTLAATHPGLLKNHVLFAIFPSPHIVAERYPLLLRHHLSVLRE